MLRWMDVPPEEEDPDFYHDSETQGLRETAAWIREDDEAFFHEIQHENFMLKMERDGWKSIVSDLVDEVEDMQTLAGELMTEVEAWKEAAEEPRDGQEGRDALAVGI